jgi:beta-aspartyl-peptidase (threonine type)
MEMGGKTLEQASNEVVNERLKKIGGDGGLIAIDKYGNISMPFNTEGMYRAAKSTDSLNEVSIY